MKNENKLSSIELEFTGHAEDSFTKATKSYIETHEGVTFVDLLKFFYQSALGPYHILDRMNENEIKEWIRRNLENTTTSDEPLKEELYGKNWVRVNLGAFKKKYGNDYQKLLNIFMKVQERKRGSIRKFLRFQNDLIRTIQKGSLRSKVYEPDLPKLIYHFVEKQREKGYPPLHHSKLYQQKNKSEYLVVSIQSLQDL